MQFWGRRIDTDAYPLEYVRLIECGRVAQLVEQRPFKAWVAGSNPAALTTRLSLIRAPVGKKMWPSTTSTQLELRVPSSIIVHTKTCVRLRQSGSSLQSRGRRHCHPLELRLTLPGAKPQLDERGVD